MKSASPRLATSPTKAPTGITGFDEITRGGLPRARTTLLVGGPGSGKTIMALQFLAHGARNCKEPGIFVAFEETSTRIVANAESFGWGLAELQRKKTLFFLDAQPQLDLVQSSDFDLGGMLAVLEAQSRNMNACRPCRKCRQHHAVRRSADYVGAHACGSASNPSGVPQSRQHQHARQRQRHRAGAGGGE
jgi:circadian clock protein KaiC